jgi:glutamate-1-semialdehyde aminotransferase
MFYRYVDYIGSWGPAIVGAANDEVNEALKAQIEKGTSFGAPSALEVSAVGCSTICGVCVMQ